MKYRITQGTNSLDGSPIFRIYLIEGETQIYLSASNTIENARQQVKRIMNPQTEVTIEEIES
jgi:hypothetical protein